MEAYDHEVLERTAQEIVRTAQDTKAIVKGPIPLPTRIERYTVLRSPHIDRKSREQFEIRTHKRLIDILQPTGKTIEALNKGLALPPGVEIKIHIRPGGSGGGSLSSLWLSGMMGHSGQVPCPDAFGQTSWSGGWFHPTIR